VSHTHTGCVTHTYGMCHTHIRDVSHTHTGCVTHTSLILRSTHNVSSFRNGVFFLLFFFLNGALCKGRQKAFYSHRLSRHNKYVAPFRNGRFFFSCFSFAQGAILIVITCISFRTGRFLFIYLFIFSCTGSHPYRHHMFPRSACHRAGRFFIYLCFSIAQGAMQFVIICFHLSNGRFIFFFAQGFLLVDRASCA